MKEMTKCETSYREQRGEKGTEDTDNNGKGKWRIGWKEERKGRGKGRAGVGIHNKTLENITGESETQIAALTGWLFENDPSGSTERGPLPVALPTDRALRLWWHSQPSPGTEEAWRTTAGHARANYPSETWRESLSCVSNTYTENTD